jgi:5S rRNA maturation endonuclease (ribonuclease M5)
MSEDNTTKISQENVIAEAIISDEQKYGPTGDGGYNTPYSMTVFYRESQIFQVAVAALSETCQAVPIIDGADLSNIAEVCEHPSPELIIFSDLEYTSDHIQKYFKRGFQKIHIFTDRVDVQKDNTHVEITANTESKESIDAGESTDAGERTESTANTESKGSVESKGGKYTQLVELSKIDNRISLFSTHNMNDGHVKLISNLTTLYIMDLITCGVNPGHVSFIRTITHKRGREFIQYLTRTTKSAREIGAILIKLATQFNGYEQAEELCSQWRGMSAERNLIARDRINSSPIIDETLYIYNGDMRNEIFTTLIDANTALPPKKLARYIVLWNINGRDIKVNVLTGGLWKDGDKTPLEFVAGSASTVGVSVASANTMVECTLTDKKFLPFLQ